MEHDLAVCDLAISSARKLADAYSAPIPQWAKIVKMLVNLCDLQSPGPLTELLKLRTNAVSGDTIVVPIQAQNACVILRRFSNSTMHEAFEIDPPNAAVMSTDSGQLIRSFPGPALEIADTASTGPKFMSHFVSFLASMDVFDLDSAASSNKAKTKVMEDKVARRLRKLSDSDTVPEVLARKVMSALEAVNLLLNERWLRVQKNQALSPHWDPRTLDIAADTRLSLSASKAYIMKRLQLSIIPSATASFTPSETPRITHGVFNDPHGRFL
ncbi:hypothetical protein DXG03_004551 [Asterophora parasitica]|uniref:DUF6606 domain-containing protein n=1 Tax=Asterophora parasitica TaxID=117018 RepID=A0A9P7FS11_9AGAR|nr:hypothetical protein DXG03_004551 [Asterophora parasitica]